MDYKFVEVTLENHKATTSELKGHREIIENNAKEGYRYAGYVPTVYGPSGKVLKIDMIFEKA